MQNIPIFVKLLKEEIINTMAIIHIFHYNIFVSLIEKMGMHSKKIVEFPIYLLSLLTVYVDINHQLLYIHQIR